MSNVYNLFTGKLVEISIQDRIESSEWNYSDIKNTIAARFGDELPKHFIKAMSKPQKQPYMHGDVHNVQYKRRTRFFNEPMPVPCEVTIDSCERVEGVLTLGSKCKQGIDEAFPWMDSKYQVTLNFLKSLSNGTELNIITRSDLIARDDYVEELKRLNVTVRLLYSSTDDILNRLNEPGAPSYKRRVVANERLRLKGISSKMKIQASKAIVQFTEMNDDAS